MESVVKNCGQTVHDEVANKQTMEELKELLKVGILRVMREGRFRYSTNFLCVRGPATAGGAMGVVEEVRVRVSGHLL